eukprot:4493647-Pyramimonas_sp.AAC.1
MHFLVHFRKFQQKLSDGTCCDWLTTLSEIRLGLTGTDRLYPVQRHHHHLSQNGTLRLVDRRVLALAGNQLPRDAELSQTVFTEDGFRGWRTMCLAHPLIARS